MNLEQQLLLDAYGFIFEDDGATLIERILRADLIILKGKISLLPLTIEGLRQNHNWN